MIEINLVPPELRRKKKSSFLGGFNIPLEVVVGSAGGVILLLVAVHFILLLTNISKIGEHKKLKSSWEEISPDKVEVDGVISELRQLQTKESNLVKMMEGKRVIWSRKMNLLSDALPKGVWLRKVALSEGVFFIEGSAISKQKREMIGVHNFAANLKKNDEFLEDMDELDLGSIQMRKISTVDVANFLITTRLKEDED